MTDLEILGTGWVNPLGRGPAAFEAVEQGATPIASEVMNPNTGAISRVFTVASEFVSDLARLPRLRRAGTISTLAVAAAKDALDAAGIGDLGRDRIGLVFVTTNGGVAYTRRFFAEIAHSGAQAGSPLLFPETVYNAPASHVSASLGLGGATETLVGDGASGLSAFAVASEMLEFGDCETCLVVGAEEADWITCEAYATWDLTSEKSSVIPHSGEGTVFADGAAAVLVRRSANRSNPTIHIPGRERRFSSYSDGIAALRELTSDCTKGESPEGWVSSASGARFDEIESSLAIGTPPNFPKVHLGESFAAAAVAQVVIADQLARSPNGSGAVLVTQVGFGGTVAALAVEP